MTFFSYQPFFSLFSLTSSHILIFLIYILVYNIYHSLFLMKNIYLIKTISPLHLFFLLELSHASDNTTSPNIGGTDA